jgi:hypothetical protein
MLLSTTTAPLIRRLWAWHQGLLVGAWVLVQAVFLLKYHGPHIANDSIRFYEYAQAIASRGYFEPNLNRRYILYLLYESVFLRLGLGSWSIVMGQLVVAALAAWALYQTVGRLEPGKSKSAAALATALFILWPETQQFNVYLLTEGLFLNLSVLALAAFVRLRRGLLRDWVLLLSLLLFCALVRPNGFVVGLAAGIAGLLTLAKQPRPLAFWLVLAGLAGISPALWQLANYQLAPYTLIETYQRGDLMFLVKAWAVHAAQPLDLPPPNLSPLVRLAYFYWHNPMVGLRLLLGKLFVFISALKPHYSLFHKVLAVLVLWPCYWLAARGTRNPSLWRPARLFLGLVPALQASIIMLTVDDYDVRFLAPVLPFIFVLAALQLCSSTTSVQKLAVPCAAS